MVARRNYRGILVAVSLALFPMAGKALAQTASSPSTAATVQTNNAATLINGFVSESSEDPTAQAALRAALEGEVTQYPDLASKQLLFLKDTGLHFRILPASEKWVNADGTPRDTPSHSLHDGLTGNYYTLKISPSAIGQFPILDTAVKELTAQIETMHKATCAKADPNGMEKGTYGGSSVNTYCTSDVNLTVTATIKRGLGLYAP